MPTNYVPDPKHTQPGQLPKVGQATVYVSEDGDHYPSIITFVGPTSPDGKMVSVAVLKLQPHSEDSTSLGNPCDVLLTGRLYNVELGKTFYCPCGPPWPDHCP